MKRVKEADQKKDKIPKKEEDQAPGIPKKKDEQAKRIPEEDADFHHEHPFRRKDI